MQLQTEIISRRPPAIDINNSHEEPLSRKLEPLYDDHQPEKSPRNMATTPGQIKPPDIEQKRRRLDIHQAQHTHTLNNSNTLQVSTDKHGSYLKA